MNQIAKSNKSVVKGLSQCRVSNDFNSYWIISYANGKSEPPSQS